MRNFFAFDPSNESDIAESCQCFNDLFQSLEVRLRNYRKIWIFSSQFLQRPIIDSSYHLRSRPSSNLGREKWVWVRKEQITNEIYRSLDKRTPVMRRFDNLELGEPAWFLRSISNLNNILVIDIRSSLFEKNQYASGGHHHGHQLWPKWNELLQEAVVSPLCHCFPVVYPENSSNPIVTSEHNGVG